MRAVEFVYLELLRSLDPGKRIALKDGWDGARVESLTQHLVEIAVSTGGWGALEAHDLAADLHRVSRARRKVRMQSTGLSDDQIRSVLKALPIDVPEVARASTLLLSGPMGSGKSEVAEEWTRHNIDAFSADPGAPFPVWISARSLTAGTIEQSINSLTGLSLIHI